MNSITTHPRNLTNINTKVALVYKYNKDIQINGTIFYAFEYLIKLIDEIYQKYQSAYGYSKIEASKSNFWKTKKIDLPRLFVICPTSLRVPLRENYLNLFIKRYPITKSGVASFRANNYYNNEAKRILDKEEFNEYFDIKKIITKAFNQIKFCTNLEYIKELKLMEAKEPTDVEPVIIYTSYNTYLETRGIAKDYKGFVFQNRAMFQIDTVPKDTITFLYETKYQKLKTSPTEPTGLTEPSQLNQKEYKLKLGFKYFYNKKLFNTRYNDLNNMICGKPSANRTFQDSHYNNSNSANIGNKKTFIKPTKFIESKSEIGYFFSGIKYITYYRNYLKFEENNRIIPEALFYGIPIKIFKEEENLNHLNFKQRSTPQDLPEFDTSLTRYQDITKNGFREYDLEHESLLDTFNLYK